MTTVHPCFKMAKTDIITNQDEFFNIRGNMDKNKNHSEQLFLMAYCLWMIYAVLKITMWSEIELVNTVCGYLQKTAYLLLVVRFVQKKRYTKKDVAAVFLIIFSCALATHSVYNKQLIAAGIFACSAGDVKFEKILKYTLILQGVVMAVTIAASQIGIIEDVMWYDSGRIRHSLGYQYCGYPAHLLLFMTLGWLCLRKKIYLMDAAILLGMNYAMYVVTDARTDFYLVVLSVIGGLVWVKDYSVKILCNTRDFLTKYGFALLAVFSVAAHVFYNPSNATFQKINQILNGRLELGYNAVRQYGFSLLGTKIRWYGQGSLRADPTRTYNYVDCSFLKEGLSYGIIFLVILALGYFLLGKRIIKIRNHMLGWAVLMSLAYAVINAHLCVLTFNVFFLAFGELFEAEQEPEAVTVAGAMAQINAKWLAPKAQHILRIFVFLAVFCYLTLIQSCGTSYLVKYANMHMWILCGALFCLCLLCSEGEGKCMYEDRKLLWLVRIFLALIWFSDFFVTKKFRYAGFGMWAFGGFFISSWSSMRHPEKLMQEFKTGYKIWFLATIFVCILTRPAFPGIHYSGVFVRSWELGVAALFALAIFLADCCEEKKWLLNEIGAVLSLYFIWTTQKVTIVCIAAALIFVYFCFQIALQRKKKSGISPIKAFVGLAGAAVLVLGVRAMLYEITPNLGLEVVFDADAPETIKETVPALLRGGGWLNEVCTKFEILREYLLQMNLLGHKHLAKINGKNVWPGNSLIMNMYRYGIACGIAYAVMVLKYLLQALQYAVKKCDFLPLGLALAGAAAAMTESIEMPFVQLGWFAFYFGIVWMLLPGRTEENEIFEYRY